MLTDQLMTRGVRKNTTFLRILYYILVESPIYPYSRSELFQSLSTKLDV